MKNSLGLKLSYARPKLKKKKKKKKCYELKFHLKRHYRALKRCYRASWTWYIKLIKKLHENITIDMELKFYAIFIYFFKFDQA